MGERGDTNLHECRKLNAETRRSAEDRRGEFLTEVNKGNEECMGLINAVGFYCLFTDLTEGLGQKNRFLKWD